ncbi:16S rRNA (adenine(1518)-N(6)/adenine(1519)-N(6))-dimethyltransferase RsmA [Sciscionella sediminilitoris]|uniref:16S rRNA (adenine(1518)-N(6)/adenine(1519)-N(6))- dimethyltransferase RsmA n=1 Tax=Sciscionella sediminilitoris TaxID=1445613 RepID=UPI0004DFAEDB|nr:16S rRNA (adenine(1518)-N(6)/adenine(1519)-N(6))-dimethyltransferase RsmA [Sciscionella sp. SE31]
MPELLGPAEIRALAEELGVRPTKRLGQNFVHDPNTVRRIVASAELGPEDVVLEVGPGLGSLTLALLPAAAEVIAVEVDETLANRLPATIAEHVPEHAGRAHVLHRDALRLTAAELPAVPTAVVANLPYNIAVPVVLHLLAELPSVRTALVMVQAEVADRMVAGPGSREYGVPSVKIAWHARACPAGSVPRSVFWPVPNVDSKLVRLRRTDPPAELPREPVFAAVDAAFAQRRKTLRAALAGWAGSAAEAERLLRAAGIEPSTRGEALTVAQFAELILQQRAGAGYSQL